MTSIEILGTTSGAEKWQRLAPAAIIHFAIQFVMQFLKQGIQGLAPLGFLAFTAGENRWFFIGLIGIGVATLLLVAAFLSYQKFKFRLSGDTFLIQKGVFKRKRLSLAYDRIQNVAFKQPIYFRPFNLVALGIESAGSSGEEVSLAGIPRSLAEEIRTLIFEKRDEIKLPSDVSQEIEDRGSKEKEADGEEIIKQPISELVRYGLSNNNIWVLASVIAGTFAQVEWDDYVVLAGARDLLEQISAQGKFAAVLVGIGTFAAIVAVLLSVSVLGAIITYYGYRLTRSDGRFHRTTGLFERRETSLPEHKVQSLVIRQAWPARLLNRFHLQLRKVGFSRTNSQNPQRSDSKLLVPSVTAEFSRKFSNLLYPAFDWHSLELKNIHTAFIRRTVVWILIPIAIIPATGLSIAFGPIALIILLLPILLTPLVMLRRVRYGYATDGKFAVIRSGFIGHKLTLFPFYKVQTVRLWQSPGQRKRGLASLSIKLAGFSLEIPYMPLEEARDWRDRILYEVESHKGSWM